MSKTKGYPFNDDNYEYETAIERINLDDECNRDLNDDNGFIVKSARGIKKALKEPDGIFSTRFGQTLQDVNAFGERYKCKCGEMMGRVLNGVVCKNCKTEVKFVDDNLSYFGWLKLNAEYCIIHPNAYKMIEYLLKTRVIENIIKVVDNKDEDGNSIDIEPPKDEPFYGIGMLEFRERFDEIMEYYVKLSPAKRGHYENIMADREKIFINSIPVFTTLLRPFKEERDFLFYNDMNATYSMMSKLSHVINNDKLKIFRKKKPKLMMLNDLQVEYNKLYKEIIDILSSKKGRVRTLFGGRCTFSARNVIIPSPELRVDEVTLSYFSLVELLQQTIINILVKSHNMTYNDAYSIWFKATLNIDQFIYNIIDGLIKSYPRGIPIIINRNPSINYGSILQMYIVGINKTHTMGLPLQILKTMGADFDKHICRIIVVTRLSKPF